MDNDRPSPLEDASIVALDHGLRRIGVAVKPAGQPLALPLRVVDASDQDAAMRELRQIIAERNAAIVVVGLPVNSDPAQAREAKRFARRLREGISGVRWRFVDETLTSHAAEQSRLEAGLPRPRGGDDASAAALILEAFLQNPA